MSKQSYTDEIEVLFDTLYVKPFDDEDKSDGKKVSITVQDNTLGNVTNVYLNLEQTKNLIHSLQKAVKWHE